MRDSDCFCKKCGASAFNRDEAKEIPNKTDVIPLNTDTEKPKPSMARAIVAFVFGVVALSGYLGVIPGIVFAIIAKKMSKDILMSNPTGATRIFAKLGRIFGNIALPVCIYCTALVFLLLWLYLLIYIYAYILLLFYGYILVWLLIIFIFAVVGMMI